MCACRKGTGTSNTYTFHENAPVTFERLVASIKVQSLLMQGNTAKSVCIFIKSRTTTSSTQSSLSKCKHAVLALGVHTLREGGGTSNMHIFAETAPVAVEGTVASAEVHISKLDDFAPISINFHLSTKARLWR